jgi:hypothetical protein
MTAESEILTAINILLNAIEDMQNKGIDAHAILEFSKYALITFPKKRSSNAIRQQRFRDKNRLKSNASSNASSVTERNASVTDRNALGGKGGSISTTINPSTNINTNTNNHLVPVPTNQLVQVPTNTKVSNTSDRNASNVATVTPRQQWFERFWAVYPRKVGKMDASRSFAKIPEDQLWAVIRGATQFATQSISTDPKYIPHPSTWLNGGRWMDEDLFKPPPGINVNPNNPRFTSV